MIVRFHHAFAVSTGHVYMPGQIATVVDADGYKAVAAKAATPGRRVTVKVDNVLVGTRQCAAGDVLDVGDFDTSFPVSGNFQPTTKLTVLAPFVHAGREVKAGDTADVGAAYAPGLIVQGLAKFAEACTYPVA